MKPLLAITLANGNVMAVPSVLRMATNHENNESLLWIPSPATGGGETCVHVTEDCWREIFERWATPRQQRIPEK